MHQSERLAYLGIMGAVKHNPLKPSSLSNIMMVYHLHMIACYPFENTCKMYPPETLIPLKHPDGVSFTYDSLLSL